MLACILPSTSLAQSTNALPTLESLVHQWIDLRTQLADESRAWTEQERQWHQEIDLYKQERDALKREGEAATRVQQTLDQAQMDLDARREKLDAALNALRPAVDRAEVDLRHWEPCIPPPLREPLADAFRRLPRTHEDAHAIDLSRRLQLVLALYTQIEELGRGTHVVKEILDDKEGGRREVDVLYLGLARGFAVAPDGASWAACGIPTADGWQWTPRPEIARAVRTAVAVQRRDRIAELVDLPIATAEVTK